MFLHTEFCTYQEKHRVFFFFFFIKNTQDFGEDVFSFKVMHLQLSPCFLDTSVHVLKHIFPPPVVKQLHRCRWGIIGKNFDSLSVFFNTPYIQKLLRYKTKCSLHTS